MWRVFAYLAIESLRGKSIGGGGFRVWGGELLSLKA